MLNVIHYALARRLEALAGVCVCKQSINGRFERKEDEQDRVLEELNAYKKKNQKHEKTMVEKSVTMKATTRSQMNLENNLSRLETKNSL